jgi:hypothetical protein
MGLFGTCCGGTSETFKRLSRAAAKSAAAKLRRAGMIATRVDWAARAAACERCPLRVVRRGVSHCGKPLLEQLHREASEGCGCPTHAKAKDPGEHCPLTVRHEPAQTLAGSCDCKWCAL